MGGGFFGFDADERGSIQNVLYGVAASSNLNVIVAEYLDERQISFLAQFFNMCGAKPLIIYPFPRIVTDHDLRKGVEKFFIDNVIDNLADFLNPGNAVVTVGRGLYAATRDTGLQVDAFYYSDECQRSYFYCPALRNYVYPIDHMAKIIKTEYRGKFVQLFDRYATEFAKGQVKKALGNHGGHLVSPEPVEIEEVPDANARLREWIASPEEKRRVALDLETGGFNRLSDEIGCVTLSFDGRTAYYLKWKGIDTALLHEFLKDKYLIFANGKFDISFLLFHGVGDLKISWDTMIAGHFINEMMSASLKTHTWVYTEYGGYDLELEKYRRKYPGCRYIDIPTPILKRYAGMDAACTWLIWEKQREVMAYYPGLLSYYEKYALGMLDVFKEMEFRGFPVDWNTVNEQSAFLKKKIAEAEKAVFDAFGITKSQANANLLTSKKQLGLFLEDRGWECLRRVKSRIGGYYKVSKNELYEWKKKGYAEAALILGYNKWIAIFNTFIGAENANEDDLPEDEMLFDGVGESANGDATGLWQYRRVDDKIHSIYRCMMTHSHRHSCVAKGTKIMVNRGYENNSMGISIEDIKIGDLVYCFDDDCKPAIRKVKWVGKTGHKEVIRIHYRGSRDHKGFLDVTPEHKIRLIDGSYVEARNLTGDFRNEFDKKRHCPKIRVLSIHRDGDRVYATNCREEKEYRLVYEQITGIKLQNRDGNHNNHTIDCIEWRGDIVDVYDLEVEEYHNFIANEVCIANSSEPNQQNLAKRNWETAKLVRECYTAPLEMECGKEDADFVKVYDAEYGLRIFKPGDTFPASWNLGEYAFDTADETPSAVVQYYRRIPKGDFHIFEADASGLQARIAASMSGDPKLRDLFLNNGDFHSTNAYNMMARYQLFKELRCVFSSGEKTFMEWEPLKIIRGGKELEHTLAKDLRAGDIVEPYGALDSASVTERHLRDYEEYVKNCKYGKLKELRQIAKMCFAKGTKIRVSRPKVKEEDIADGDLLLMTDDTGTSMHQWSGGKAVYFDTRFSLADALLYVEKLGGMFGRKIYFMELEDGEPSYYRDRAAYVNIEDIAETGVFGYGVPYAGTLTAMTPEGKAAEIVGTIAVHPKEKIEFVLENGYRMAVTIDHEMPVLRDGKRVVVPAERVRETDEIIEVVF